MTTTTPVAFAPSSFTPVAPKPPAPSVVVGFGRTFTAASASASPTPSPRVVGFVRPSA